MFKLNIECTKDFDELHIIFSDGTSTFVSNKNEDDSTPSLTPKKSQVPRPTPSRNTHQPIREQSRNEVLLDTEADWGGVPQDIVKKPVIEKRDRPVKVAEELQNLDI